jgi:colanic acid/amylovoran biosynthesis protein
MRLRKVLLTNCFTTNIGDLAILQAMVDHVKKLGKGIAISAHCSDVGFAKKKLPLKGVEYNPSVWPMVNDPPGLSDALMFGLVYASNLLSLSAYRLLGLELFLFNGKYKESFRDFVESDIVISIGGGFISADYGVLRPYSDYLMAKLLGKRLILYSQSIGPFDGSVQKLLSRFILGAADVIILREEKSADNLKDIGITNVHVTTDMAFALPKPKRKPGKKNKVIIVPRRWTYPYRHSASSYKSFIVKLTEKLVGEIDSSVTFIPTTPDDIRFWSSFRKDVPEGVTFLDELRSPSEIAKEISESDFIVSSRMHPIILGSLSSTPFFAIGWEYKLDELNSALCKKGCCVHA